MEPNRACRYGGNHLNSNICNLFQARSLHLSGRWECIHLFIDLFIDFRMSCIDLTLYHTTGTQYDNASNRLVQSWIAIWKFINILVFHAITHYAKLSTAVDDVSCNYLVWYGTNKVVYVKESVQNCSNSMANALELLLSCTKPSISYFLPISATVPGALQQDNHTWHYICQCYNASREIPGRIRQTAEDWKIDSPSGLRLSIWRRFRWSNCGWS